jgi:acetolactate synthase-1/2/3 large subunit
LGDQEADIVAMVKGITKYAVVVDDPQSIRYHLERAIHLAKDGRPGPCWLDVPIDVQGAKVDPAALRAYDPQEDAIRWETADLDAACRRLLEKVSKAKRPVIYAGTGIRLGGAYEAFLKLAERWGIPVVTAWNSNDLLWDEHPCYAGRPGSLGNRAGNFAVQNADVLLVLGCRLNIRLVSYNWENFAPRAYKIAVDIDAAEMRKPTCKIDFPIHADVAQVIDRLLGLPAPKPAGRAEWLAWCRERVEKYPVVLPEYKKEAGPVNPYVFMESLFAQLGEDEVIACGDGTACVTAFQAARVRKGQRLFHNSGCASMGYDLPAAIGAAYARPGQRVICLAGDGSVMMNLQELETIAGRKLPVKLFILNNRGYHSIRQTQQNFFPDNVVGCGTDSGLSFPDFGKLADAFGLRFVRSETHATLDIAVAAALEGHDAVLCEIVLDLGQPFAPKLSSRKLDDGRMVTAPPEDMAPFLSREELASNILS